MADFVDDRIIMFEPKGLDEEEGEEADMSALQAIADAIELSDDALFPELEKYVDLDQFFKYWAMEVITAHGDGEMVDFNGVQSVEIPLVRGVIGQYADVFDYNMVYMQLSVGPIDESNVVVIFIDLPGELFQEGRTVKMDYGEAMADVALFNIETEEYRALGFVMTGELTFQKIDTAPGGEVSIDLNAPIGVIQI